jgi:hypothetical protein
MADKAKLLKILGYVAMFCVGGLVYTGVLPESVALSLTTGIALLLPSPVSRKP